MKLHDSYIRVRYSDTVAMCNLRMINVQKRLSRGDKSSATRIHTGCNSCEGTYVRDFVLISWARGRTTRSSCLLEQQRDRKSQLNFSNVLRTRARARAHRRIAPCDRNRASKVRVRSCARADSHGRNEKCIRHEFRLAVPVGRVDRYPSKDTPRIIP